MEKEPLISCVCVTKNRANLLRRSIDCFLHQTYSNKELVIIFQDDDAETKSLVNSLGNQMIRGVEVSSSPQKSLGELRNISIAESRGEYFCNWDDDDWHHKERLRFQMNAIRLYKKNANALVFWLMFDTKTNKAYLSAPATLPGSILCKKEIISECLQYPGIERGEDLVFYNLLVGQNQLCPVVMPSLYIYIYNGNNTWDRGHFERLFAPSQELSPNVSQLIKDVVELKYDINESSELLFNQDVLEDLNLFHAEIPYKR